VIRGRCRNGLPSDRHKTPGGVPLGRASGVSCWLRLSASVQIQSPRLFSETSPSSTKSKCYHIAKTRFATQQTSSMFRAGSSAVPDELTQVLSQSYDQRFKSCHPFRPSVNRPLNSIYTSRSLCAQACGGRMGALAYYTIRTLQELEPARGRWRRLCKMIDMRMRVRMRFLDRVTRQRYFLRS
jgi:hypothetical protein